MCLSLPRAWLRTGLTVWHLNSRHCEFQTWHCLQNHCAMTLAEPELLARSWQTKMFFWLAVDDKNFVSHQQPSLHSQHNELQNGDNVENVWLVCHRMMHVFHTWVQLLSTSQFMFLTLWNMHVLTVKCSEEHWGLSMEWCSCEPKRWGCWLNLLWQGHNNLSKKLWFDPFS